MICCVISAEAVVAGVACLWKMTELFLLSVPELDAYF